MLQKVRKKRKARKSGRTIERLGGVLKMGKRGGGGQADDLT